MFGAKKELVLMFLNVISVKSIKKAIKIVKDQE